MRDVNWTRAAMEACTSGVAVCEVAGCARVVYYGRRCSGHYHEPPTPETCGHAAPIITCGCCGRLVCEECFGAWNMLACGECRERARAS